MYVFFIIIQNNTIIKQYYFFKKIVFLLYLKLFKNICVYLKDHLFSSSNHQLEVFEILNYPDYFIFRQTTICSMSIIRCLVNSVM